MPLAPGTLRAFTYAMRPTLAAPDDDPYLWLEEIDGAPALAWVDAQTQATRARFADARFAADRDAVLANLDRPDNIAWVTRRGDWLYNFWRDARHPRGLWRRTTLAQYRTPSPEWEPILDLDALAVAEGEDWVWGGTATIPRTHDLAIIRLSRGGSDAAVLREFDIPAHAFAAGGFAMPEAKGNAVWLDRDTLLLSSALGDGMATRSGYARTVRLWRRGQDAIAAPVIFEAATDSMGVDVALDRESNRVVFLDRIGFNDTVIWLGDHDGARQRLDLPTDARPDWQHDWLAVRLRTPWTVAGTTYPGDTVLGIAWSAFLNGDRRFTVLFAPAERRALQGFFWCGGRLVLSILDNLQPAFTVLSPGASGWSAATLPGLPPLGVVNVWPLDDDELESDGTLLANTQDPVTPPTLLLTGLDLAAPEVLRQAPHAFNSAGLIVTRHEAVSVDGERIPYVQVGPAADPFGKTGDAPVHLTGYGGFLIPTLPYYRGIIGKLWLEKSGTAVTASIRGGGEFGTRWHVAGMRAGKSRSHDDFAAVAADLVRRGITRPGRIAAEGGSNGGLLIANMLTRYPERFGALFCTIPLIDMRRYTKLLAGASWIAEYGDPDNPEDWDFIRDFSAYHAAEPGRPYPPILLATSRRDDRVHPGHARKMAAKLQAMGYEAWFYEPTAGGHGYGKDNAEAAAFTALGAAFLRRAIGWETQTA